MKVESVRETGSSGPVRPANRAIRRQLGDDIRNQLQLPRVVGMEETMRGARWAFDVSEEHR